MAQTEHIREGFTNLRDDIGKELDRYYLSAHDGSNMISMSDLPTLTLPCNFLSSSEPEEGKGGYYPPAEHINTSDGSLAVTSFTVGGFSYESEIGNDGLVDVDSKITFNQSYIYKQSFKHQMRMSEPEGVRDSTPGTIQLGGSEISNEPIADDYGVVDGLEIHADGSAIYLPDWDLTLSPDDFLENAPYAGAKNNKGLPSEIEENICHDRSYIALEAEIARIEFCQNHENPQDCDKFIPSNAFDNCKATCKGQASVNKDWLSDCNPCVDYSRRVDAAHQCDCGGTSCKGEDLSCGWEMILNRSS